MKRDKLLNVFLYGLFFLLVLGIVLFQNNIKNVFVFGSIMGILIGVLLLFKRAKIGFLILSFSISGVSSFLVYNGGILSFNDSVTFMVCLTVAFMIILSDIFMYKMRKAILKKYSMIVIGEVIDLEKNKNTKKEFYKVVYRYKIEDMEYIVDDPRYKKSNIPAIGEKREILLDPDNFLNTYFLPEKREDLLVISASFVFLAAAIGILLSLF